MADYTTLADVKAQLTESLGSSTDTTYDALISSLITSASRAIDGYLGQEDDYFHAHNTGHSSSDDGSTDHIPAHDEETRYYDGNGVDRLKIDDFISISELAVSEEGSLESTNYTVWTSSDYYVYPYNAYSKGKPYNTLVIDNLNGDKGAFYAFPKSVRVVGVFGYSAHPPQDVIQACNIMVIRYFMRAKNAFADAGANPNIGQMFYVRELDPDVKLLLNKYVIENL